MKVTSEATVMFHSFVAQSMGLDLTAYKALFLLKRLGPMSATDMAAETGLATASITNLVDRLVAKGYVTREADSRDRRRIIITLIDEAVATARQGFGEPNTSLLDLCESYEPDQLEIISDFLTRNARRLSQDLMQARHP